ncbi:unnamed protein product [Diamesa hyperborea]
MENIEFFDVKEQNPETVVDEAVDGDDDELIYEDVEYLDEDENPLPRESNESLSVLSMDHEAVEVVPLQGKITLANLHEALQFTTPLNSFEELAMQPGKSKSPSTQSRKSRPQKVYPNAIERRSSRIAKQNLKQDSNRTIYPTAKGSNKQIGKKTASAPQASKQNPRKRASSRSRSRTASSAAKKAKSSSVSRKVSSTTKTTKKAKSASRRSRQTKK